MLGLGRRQRLGADAVGKHSGSEQSKVAELTQQDDVVQWLDRTEPVDELVEVESVGWDRGGLWHGEAGQQLGRELQPSRIIGELDERFDVENREPATGTGPLVDPIARQQLFGGAVNQDREEQPW